MSNQAIGHKRTILKNLQYPNFMFLQHFLSLSFILGKKLYYQHDSLIYQNSTREGGIKGNYCPEVTVWLNGWVFVYELSACVFESSCSHLTVTIFRVFLVRIFPHSDWIRRVTEQKIRTRKNSDCGHCPRSALCCYKLTHNNNMNWN